jgi:hypothetical protein
MASQTRAKTNAFDTLWMENSWRDLRPGEEAGTPVMRTPNEREGRR